MRILKIEVGAFGKLENFVLEPSAGLNVYREPNEFGKTTLICFIYFMFYGYEAKTMKGYLPWSGADLAGSLTFEQGGQQWRIERRRKSTEKRQVINLTTGKEHPLARGEQPGELFFGLDGDTFLRSFCVNQGDLIFACSNGLDVALKNMAATGDENVSYERAEKWLNAEHTKYEYRKRHMGPLPDLQEELTQDQLEYSRVNQQMDAEVDAHREWEALEQAIPQSEEKISALRLRLKEAEGSDALKLLQQLDAIRQKKPPEAPAVSQAKLAELEQAFEAAEQANAALRQAEEAQQHREESLRLVEDQLHRFGFNALTAQELEKLRKKGFPFRILLVGAAVAAAVLGAVTQNVIAFGAAGVLLVLGVIAVLSGNLARRRICHGYGAANERQLLEKWADYERVLQQKEELTAAREVSAAQYRQCKETVSAATARLDTLRDETRIFSLSEVRKMRMQWAVYESSLEREDPAQQERLLLGGLDRETLERLAAGATLKEETAAQVRPLLAAAEAENRRLRDRREQLDPHRLAALWKEHRALKTGIRKKKDTVEAWKQELAAVRQALAWLEAANEEMSTQFAPRLCQLAGEHLARITAGKYTTLLMDAAYTISLTAAEGTYPLERFSAGTRDAVYFAFRLAVSSLLSTETLPMVLDDPFVNLDPIRLKGAEELLEKAGEERQILYFSCR